MKLANILKRNKITVDFLLKNDECKKLVDQFGDEDLPNATAVIIIFEDKEQQTYWKCAGMEPAQAILTLDQLHHRIQHEGLPGYD